MSGTRTIMAVARTIRATEGSVRTGAHTATASARTMWATAHTVKAAAHTARTPCTGYSYSSSDIDTKRPPQSKYSTPSLDTLLKIIFKRNPPSPLPPPYPQRVTSLPSFPLFPKCS